MNSVFRGKSFLVGFGLLIGAVVLWQLLRPAPVAEIQPVGSSGASDSLREGVHYRTLQLPASESETGAVTVTEYFWYGCPHCRAFESKVHSWLENAPDDIRLEQIPVVWNELTGLHAALYYIGLEADDPEGLHKQLFDKIIELRPERKPEVQRQLLVEVFERYGVPAESYSELLKSTGVQDRVAAAEKSMRDAVISSTPTVVVNHQWIVLNNEDVGEYGVFNVIDALVERARSL